MLTCAEIEGLKQYHFKEMHQLQDQVLAQRSAVSKLTLRLQEAMQVQAPLGSKMSTIMCMANELNLLVEDTTMLAHDDSFVSRAFTATDGRPTEASRWHHSTVPCREGNKLLSFKTKLPP